MSDIDRMLGWFPHTSREWIELIIVTILLWLLLYLILSGGDDEGFILQSAHT